MIKIGDYNLKCGDINDFKCKSQEVTIKLNQNTYFFAGDREETWVCLILQKDEKVIWNQWNYVWYWTAWLKNKK